MLSHDVAKCLIWESEGRNNLLFLLETASTLSRRVSKVSIISRKSQPRYISIHGPTTGQFLNSFITRGGSLRRGYS